MIKIYNEFGISLVLGSGNWMGVSCEVEDGDREERFFGWKKIPFKNPYFRFWLYKWEVLGDAKNGFRFRRRNKIALKIIFGFSN